VAEAGLRAIVVPEQPTIRGYRQLPNGSTRLTIGLVNQSEGIALRGHLSVTVAKGAIPSDIIGIDPFGIGFVPIVESASFPSFAALRGGARIALVATVPRRVVRARTPKTGPYQFVLTYRTTTGPTDIVEVWRPRYDINRFGPLEVRTKSHGAIRVDSHLRGLIDLLLELRLLNPGLKTERV
jgi:hypothetical protein